MFEGQLLMRRSTAYSVYSPWFRRGGSTLRAAIQKLAGMGTDAGATLMRVEVFTKNADDASGTGTNASASQSIDIMVDDSDGHVEDATWGPNELQELVRYKFTMPASGGNEGYVLFRTQTPVWWDEMT